MAGTSNSVNIEDELDQNSSGGSETDSDVESELDAAEIDALPGTQSSNGESDSDEDIVYDPCWMPNTLGLRRIIFSKENKLLVPVPGDGSPYDWFMLLMDEVLLDSIVRYTNQYAWEIFLGPNTTPNSRINKWKELTTEELKLFIGLIIHMGTVKLNRITDYWKTSRYFNFPFVRDIMSRDRFLLIMRCIHFCSNQNVQAEVDRLHKIRLLIDHFNSKMLSIYYPSRELSLDEGTVLWRGRLKFRQYIKGKRHKYGVKIYSLCEPGGLCIAFTVYSGKDGELSGKGHAEKVVMHLMRHRLGVGHSIFMDNYYNSYPLASKLLANSTYCTGTLRIDRKHLPREVTQAKLQKGETVARYADGVMVAKWRDKRQVLYLSTEFENTMGVSINRRNVERQKPVPIIYYNANMKGVDRNDQLMAYHPSEHKSIRWYKKIFVHFIQMMVVNSFKLYSFANQTQAKRKLYDFRLTLLDQLLPPRLGPSPKRPRYVAHVLSKSDKREKIGTRFLRRRCQMCAKNKKVTKTVYFCAQCPGEPALCELACFDKWHKQ